MKCRVGITADLAVRQLYWANRNEEFPYGFGFWELIGNLSRADAQDMENFLKDRLGCEGHHGGGWPRNPSSLWSVYYIEAPEHSDERAPSELPQRVNAATYEWLFRDMVQANPFAAK